MIYTSDFAFPKKGKWLNVFILFLASLYISVHEVAQLFVAYWYGQPCLPVQSSPVSCCSPWGTQDRSGWRQLVDCRLCSQPGVPVARLSLPLHCSDFCWWHCIVLEACKSVRVQGSRRTEFQFMPFHSGNIYVTHGVLDCKKQTSVLTVTSEDLCTVYMLNNGFNFSTSVIVESWSHLGFQNTL